MSAVEIVKILILKTEKADKTLILYLSIKIISHCTALARNTKRIVRPGTDWDVVLGPGHPGFKYQYNGNKNSLTCLPQALGLTL